MKVTVSGLYRSDVNAEHGEPAEVSYSVSFEVPDMETQSEMIKRAAELVAAKDPKFNSLKTHKIEKGLI